MEGIKRGSEGGTRWVPREVGEMLVAAVILWIIESPGKSMAADGESDLVEGKVASLFDAFYWTFPTFTCYVDKSQKPFGGKAVMMAQRFYMVVIIASYIANLATSLRNA